MTYTQRPGWRRWYDHNSEVEPPGKSQNCSRGCPGEAGTRRELCRDTERAFQPEAGTVKTHQLQGNIPLSGRRGRETLLKRKIQLSESEDLIGFIQSFMSQAACRLVNTRVLWEVIQNGAFYREEGEARAMVLAKENGTSCGQNILFLWGRDHTGFIMQTTSSSSGEGRGIKRGHWQTASLQLSRKFQIGS